MDTESKITIFVAIQDEQRRNDLMMLLMTELQDVLVLSISDLQEYEHQVKKASPRLVVSDGQFLAGNTVLRTGMSSPELVYTSFIILGSVVKDEYLDELMLGKLQFLPETPSDEEWKNALKKSFKFSLESKTASFQIKLLKANEFLMKAGDPGDKVFILKRGKLQAFQLNSSGEKLILGDVIPGEFVGEMAYFNAEPRVASVIALIDSELIEIPIQSFERALYQRPAGSMKLIDTLSKRLKKFLQKE